jgi:hypothetical protein
MVSSRVVDRFRACYPGCYARTGKLKSLDELYGVCRRAALGKVCEKFSGDWCARYRAEEFGLDWATFLAHGTPLEERDVSLFNCVV